MSTSHSETSSKNFAQKNAPQKNRPDSDFEFNEVKVMSQFGLSRDAIRELRQKHLTEGEHFAPIKKRIYLTQEGVEIIRQALLLPRSDVRTAPTASSEKNAQPGASAAHPEGIGTPLKSSLPKLLPAPFKGELIAWSSPMNEHILMAHMPGADPGNQLNMLRVRVRSNKNFVRGMKLQARHIQEDLYELVGNCPRDRGRY